MYFKPGTGLPRIQSGDGGKVLSVKTDESGYELSTPSAGGGGEERTMYDIEYYVDPATGSDDNSGTTQTAPFATIAKALSLIPKIINHYVFIKLAPGTYTEHVCIEGFRTEITADCYNYAGFLDIYGPDAIFTKDALDYNFCMNLEVWRHTYPYNYNPETMFFISNCDIPIVIGGHLLGGNDMVFDMSGGYENGLLPPYQSSCAILAVNCKQPISVRSCKFEGNTGEKKGGVWAYESTANVNHCTFDRCNAFYAIADGENGNIIMGEATETNTGEVYSRLQAINHGVVTIAALNDMYTLDTDKDLMKFGGKIYKLNEEIALKKDIVVYVYENANVYYDRMDWDSEENSFPSIQAALDSLPKFIDGTVTINVDKGARTESALFKDFHGAGQIKVFLYDDAVASTTPTTPKVVQLSPSSSVKATLAFVGNTIPIEFKGYNAAYKFTIKPYAEAGSVAIAAINNAGLIRFESVVIEPVAGYEDISSGILAMNSPVYITGSVVNNMAEVAKVLAGGRVELNTLTGTSNVKLYDCAAYGHLSVDAFTISNCAITGSNSIAVDTSSVTWREFIRAFSPRVWTGASDPGATAKSGDVWINATTVKIRNEANSDWITIS